MTQAMSENRTRVYVVKAFWDSEAEVWVATSDDVAGLATEADTVDRLLKKLEVIVPELLEANADEPLLLDRYPVVVEMALPVRPTDRAA